jgi:hypothetical protein
MLVQQLQPQLVRPPVAVRPADACDVGDRALEAGPVGVARLFV